jgi:hypothetical protein
VSRPCVRCGRRGDHQHHLTLRDECGKRLDDDLVVWLCRVCHLHAHNVLRILELERAVGPLSAVERVELRLRRVAAFLAGLGAPWSVLTDPLAGHPHHAPPSGLHNPRSTHRLQSAQPLDRR